MDVFSQALIGGLAVGGIYGLVALGFTIIYRSLYVINFAQGQVFMVGCFMGFVGFSLAETYPVTVFVVVLIAGSILAIITTFLVYSTY